MAAPVPHPAQTSLEIAQRAASILSEHKANDVVLLSLEGVSDMTDYFLIASGTSDTHVRSLGNSVLEEMKRDVGQMAHHVEKRQIELHEPIKALGVYRVPIRLHADVKPEIKVWVIKQ